MFVYALKMITIIMMTVLAKEREAQAHAVGRGPGIRPTGPRVEVGASPYPRPATRSDQTQSEAPDVAGTPAVAATPARRGPHTTTQQGRAQKSLAANSRARLMGSPSQAHPTTQARARHAQPARARTPAQSESRS